MLKKMSQVAERLNCSLSSAYGLVESGLLPVISVGTRKGLRVSDEDLAEFIAARRTHRGKSVPSPRVSNNPFKHLDGKRLRNAWREQGVE